MTDERSDRLERLAEAIETYLKWKEGGRGESLSDFLGRDEFVDSVGRILGLCGFRWVKLEDFAEAYGADKEYQESILEELREEYPRAILIE